MAGLLHWRVIHPRRIRADEQRIRGDDHDQLHLAPVRPRPAGPAEQTTTSARTSTATAGTSDRTTSRRNDILIAISPLAVGVMAYVLAPWLVHTQRGDTAEPNQLWRTAAPLLGLLATTLLFTYGYLDHTGHNKKTTLNIGFLATLTALASAFCYPLMLLL
ncbi:hypothetical protein AB0N05_37465 [Nocardia sp. NPDC051030]|uniref:hypothetical protein n=1 Tax=Nocardia sp. NPDC051030 TaxID=3155162 RepID=UPI0034209B0B